jgi:MFS family permease
MTAVTRLSRVAASYTAKVRLFSRDMRLYLITVVLFGFSIYGGITSVLLNLYLLRLDYGPRFVGLFNATAQISFSCFCLLAGAMGARWSSRWLMIAGMGLILVGYGALPLAEWIPASMQDEWLVTTYALAWLGSALYMVNGITFTMEATGPEERRHAFSVRTAVAPLAGFAGSLFGGLLPGVFGRALGISMDHPAAFRYTLWLAVLVFAGAPLVMLASNPGRWEDDEARTARGSAAAPPQYGRVLPLGLIALIALVGFLRCAGQGTAHIFFNVYLDLALGAPTALIGLLSAAGQLAVVPAVLTMPLLAARWGTAGVVVCSSLSMALGLVPLALVPHWFAAGLGYVDVMAFFSIASTSFTVYSQELVAVRWRAVMAGVSSMAAGMSGAAMAVLGGHLIVSSGYTALFLAGAGLTTIGALVFWAYFRVPRGEYARLALDRERL